MFIIYTLDYCPYSKHALSVLKALRLKHKNIEVKGEKEKNKLCRKHKMNSFPQILYKMDKKIIKIGGCTELLEFIELCKYLNTTPFNIDLIYKMTKLFKRRKIR